MKTPLLLVASCLAGVLLLAATLAPLVVSTASTVSRALAGHL